ncbi:MAG: AhpC/TSA family protein [Chitinophagaceae bacterium]|nr:MAG: AhpC/TSA family protein [Chitinophagaceae bacterium]
MPVFSAKLLLYPAFWLLLLGLYRAAPPVEKNTISGTIRGLAPGSVQLIVETDINRKKERVLADIDVDASGRFHWEGAMAPNIYRLQIGPGRSIRLALDRGQQVLVQGDATGPLQVTGSKDTELLEAYEAFRKGSLLRLVQPVRDAIRALEAQGVAGNDPRIDSLALQETRAYGQHKDELIGFVRTEMGTSIAVYATSIRWDGAANLSFLTDLAARFAGAHPGTEIAARVAEKVRVLAASSVGGKVAGIQLPDSNGVTIALSSVRARYLLVDFWGSWCLPCRRESGLLGELYRTYKPQGFEIYAVGLESKKENWLRAIERDKRSWINVSGLQLFETPAAFDYSVTALPANVLIDSSGTVIARNLHGAELKKTLGRLFEK